MGSFAIRLILSLPAAILFATFCHAFGATQIHSTADESSELQDATAKETTGNSENTQNKIESDEERKALAANDRFLTLLKKQPKPGTALDRVYAFHLERGSLDQFLSEQRALMTAGDDTGIACLLVGLFETKRGNHREAEAAFQLAEERRPQDASTSWLLGQSLLELQRAEEAAKALERAMERSPQKADLLLIFQDLGRAYRRSRQTEKANAVWQQMESQFPNDLRLKEQIATTLFDEGDLEAAVVRFAELSKLHRDPYQKTQNAITAADLKLQLGRQEEALRDFEEQLQTLDPESWLARDIRHRIDKVFLRNNNQAALVSYYETWLQNHPDDLEVISSLGRALSLQGRSVDAQAWYRKALEKAPASIPLRKSLLEQLARARLFDEAMTQYEKLLEIDPGNIEHLQDWGLLALYRDDVPLRERRANAKTIWKRMLSVRPDDPGILVQVAELMRRAELSDDALPLYRRAIELAPQDTQYREYLGDYLKTLGRTEEAVQVWNTIAEGDQRNTANLIRLAEIFRAAGLQDKAISTMQAACELNPDITDHLKLARWLREYEVAGNYPRAADSLKELDIAETLAETDEERAILLTERILSLLAADQLDQAIGDLKLRLQKTEEAGKPVNNAEELQKSAAEWTRLATYFEAAKKLPDAMEAVKKSTVLAPDDVASWTLAARLYEQSGRLADAVEAYQKLMPLDLRAGSECLQKIASLEQRLGRRAEALKAGKELLAAGPDNPEFVKFYADLCFHFGERQEALKTLRRSVRSSSADGTLILALARTLANQNEIDEATALCWTAFEKSASLDDKSSAVMMLAEFALRVNRFDQLVEKLEQHGRVSGQEQDASQCLATAYRVAGDLRSAREALETLLVVDNRDSQLLLQLSRLAEEDGDLEAAADYQRRANLVLASDEGETRLANLLVRLGDLSEAEALWTRIGSNTAAPADVIEAIDQLIALESVDSAREICDRALKQNPGHWEVLIRRGILEWRYGQREMANPFFQRVLDLNLDSNTPSATLNTALEQADPGEQLKTQRLPALARLEMVPELAKSFQESMPSWWFGQKVEPELPRDYGAARIVATIGCYLAARPSSSESAIPEQLSEDAASGKLQATLDQMGLEIFILDRTTDKLFTDYDFQKFMLAAEAGDIEAQAMWLELLARRINVREVNDDVESTIDDLPTQFLSESQFSLLMNSFDNVLNQKPEWLETFDAPRLFFICRHQQQIEKLDSLIATLLQREEAGPKLSMGIDLGLLRQTLTVQSALDAMSRKKSAPGTMNSAGAVEMNSGHEADFESFSPGLLKTARIRPTPNEVHPGLKVLDWWLEWRRDFRGEFGLRPDPGFEHEAAREMIDGVIFRNRTPDFGLNSAVLRKDSNIAAKLGVRNRFTDEECEFLTQVFVLFLQENSSQQLTDWFETKAESSEKARLADLELMQVVFWNIQRHQERVLLHLVRAIEQLPDDNLLKLVVALRLEELNMRAEAIELIGQLPDTDTVLLKCREFKSLDLANTLQLSEVAKVSLTRLAGMDLSESERDYVFREVGRLGLEDLRADLESRRTKVNAESIEASPLALLDHYEQQGNPAAAVQVAQQLLRRSHKNPTPWRNTTRPTPEQIYARAYKVLKETGELEKMIERQKAQLAKSPHSGRLQKTLLDYLEAAGRMTEADELRASRQRNEPGLSVKVLITQAEELMAAKQPQLAGDKFLEVLHEHPAEFWREGTDEQVLGVFAETNRLTELADAVLVADHGRFQSFAPTETLEELIKLLLRDPKTHGKAAELIQRYSEMYPASTVSFLKLVEQLPLWSSSPDLFALLTRMYVPTNAEQRQRPQLAWPLDYEDQRVRLGFDQTAIQSGGNLKRLWDALKFSDERRVELEQSAKDAMVKIPNWPAGPVILIVCALSVPEKSLDLDRIETLVNEMCNDSNRAIPEAVAYNLTQLLRQRGERMKRVAVKLLETSLNAVPPEKLKLDQPASRALLELYAELNEPTKGQKFRRRSKRESSPMDSAQKKLQLEENSRDAQGVPQDSSPPVAGNPLAEQVKAEIRKTLLKRNP